MEPLAILALCHLQPTDSVADFGAGSGFLAKIATTLVPNGNVFAIEIHRDSVVRLTREAHDSGIKNLHPIWGDIEIKGGTKLADESMDFVIISNVLFHLDDKEGAIKEAHRVLRSGGRMLVVDWTDSFNSMGPQPHMIFPKENAQALCLRLGFGIHHAEIPAGDHHYAILFKKASIS